MAGSVVSGFVLLYADETSAFESAQAFAEYISTASGRKRLDVEFRRQGASEYQLRITGSVAGESFETVIDGIEAAYVERLAASLSQVAYYFILVGTALEGDVEQVTGSGPLFKNDVVVDGAILRGVAGGNVDWDEVGRRLTS